MVSAIAASAVRQRTPERRTRRRRAGHRDAQSEIAERVPLLVGQAARQRDVGLRRQDEDGQHVHRDRTPQCRRAYQPGARA